VELSSLAFDVAVRLLAGEVVDLVDEHGRRWRATATTLSLVHLGTGEAGLVLEGSAGDVALEVARRAVRSLAPS
jgi:hypothetical protein